VGDLMEEMPVGTNIQYMDEKIREKKEELEKKKKERGA